MGGFSSPSWGNGGFSRSNALAFNGGFQSPSFGGFQSPSWGGNGFSNGHRTQLSLDTQSFSGPSWGGGGGWNPGWGGGWSPGFGSPSWGGGFQTLPYFAPQHRIDLQIEINRRRFFLRHPHLIRIRINSGWGGW